MKRFNTWWIWAIFLALIILPYLLAILNQGNDYLFGGFLLNPKDGNSYLAKMQEGWAGSWQFTLPFTAEKGDGTYLFIFYLALGQLAHPTGLPLLLVFHIARIICAVILAISLQNFTGWIFHGHPKEARRAWLFCLFGSGMGWLVLSFGWITSDMWVSEAYPFLASFAIPHFSLGMAILLWIFLDQSAMPTWARLIRLAVNGFLLALVMPFGIVVAGLVGGIWHLWEWVQSRKINSLGFGSTFLLGGPYLLYQYWVTLTDPYLSLWNAQNVTPSPSPLDLLISFSPALILATWGFWVSARKGNVDQRLRLLLAWIAAGLVMIYIPFSLQRRFMFAFFIPTGLLAIYALGELPAFLRRRQNRIFPLIFSLSFLTIIVVIMVVTFGITSHSSEYYLTRDEVSAFDYIRENTSRDSVILSSPETGSLLPGWTGRRVIYGHEFETVSAAEKERLVRYLYDPDVPGDQALALLSQEKINYVFWGPHEKKIGTPNYLSSLQPVYQNGTIEIFSR